MVLGWGGGCWVVGVSLAQLFIVGARPTAWGFPGEQIGAGLAYQCRRSLVLRRGSGLEWGIFGGRLGQCPSSASSRARGVSIVTLVLFMSAIGGLDGRGWCSLVPPRATSLKGDGVVADYVLDYILVEVPGDELEQEVVDLLSRCVWNGGLI